MDLILTRMTERVERDAHDGDAAFFSSIILQGELLSKVIVLGSLALLDPRLDRGHRYDAEFTLVRANGTGSWTYELQKLITGPAKTAFHGSASAIITQLSQRHPAGSESWQREALEDLRKAEVALGLEGLDPRAKSALTTFFTRFTELRNKSKGHEAQQVAAQAIAAGHLQSAIQGIQTNLDLLRQPWSACRRTAAGEMRRYPLSSASCGSMEDLQEGVAVEVDGRSFKVNLAETREPLDLLLPNGDYQDRDASFQSISYITGHKERLPAAGYVTSPSALAPSETRGLLELDVQGQTWGNVPPPKQDYVARVALEEELLERLVEREQDPIITLGGPGGIGKTSTALQVLHDVASRGDFDLILWFSARDVDLLDSEGPVPVRPEVLSWADAARAFKDLTVALGVRQASSDEEDTFAQALRSSIPTMSERTLFVFDNFETILEPNALFQTLKSHVRLPNKVLITTRFTDFKGQYPIDISGMIYDEFQELVSTTASRLNIVKLVNDSPDYVRLLHKESYGHPYVVKIVLGEIARNRKVPEKFERVLGKRDDILDALFLRSLERLSTDAQRVFLTLCSWRSITPAVVLEAALRRSANEQIVDMDGALEELATSSMIEIMRPDGLEEPRWINVPAAAFKFGAARVGTHKLYSTIKADAQFIRLLGPVRPHVTVAEDVDFTYFFNRVLEALKSGSLDRRELLDVVDHVSSSADGAWRDAARVLFAANMKSQARRCMLRDAESDLSKWTTEDLRFRHELLRALIDSRQLETDFELIPRLIADDHHLAAFSVVRELAGDLRSGRTVMDVPQTAELWRSVVRPARLRQDRVDAHTADALEFLAACCGHPDEALMWKEIQRLRG